MSKINVLKSIARPLVELMAHKGLKVSFSGSDALTRYNVETGKPEEIILPVINSDADDEIIKTFHGYIDHEVAHALFTDLLGGKLTKKMESAVTKLVFNIVEDARIERSICQRFRGSAANLGHLHRSIFNDDHVAGIPSDETDPARVLMCLIYAVRAINRQSHFELMVDKYDFLSELKNDLLGKFGSDAFMNLFSSEETLELSKKIVEYLELKDQEQQESKEGEAGEGSGESGEPKEEQQESQEPKENEESEDGKHKESKGKADENSTNREDTSKRKPISPEMCDEIYEKTIMRKVKELAKSATEDQSYRVETTDNDVIEHIVESKSHSIVSDMEASVSKMTGAIQKNLERAIAARSISVWTPGRKSGKLNPSALSRLRFDDPHVFRRKEEAMSKDVAVSLVVDCSGSMCGRKSEVAAYASFALAEVLTRMGIKCELIGFTTHGACYSRGLARSAPIFMPIFKSFTDRWDMHAKLRLAKLWNEAWMDNNVDGESVQYAADRLLRQTQNGKIMIVLSDGYPSADGNDRQLSNHLKEVVADLEKKIKIVGIGICSDAVSEYYKNHVVLNEIEELPTTVVKRLRQLLLS